jgi:hypothetical protein
MIAKNYLSKVSADQDEKKMPQLSLRHFLGDPKGNRTPVAGMKTRCPDR